MADTYLSHEFKSNKRFLSVIIVLLVEHLRDGSVGLAGCLQLPHHDLGVDPLVSGQQFQQVAELFAVDPLPLLGDPFKRVLDIPELDQPPFLLGPQDVGGHQPATDVAERDLAAVLALRVVHRREHSEVVAEAQRNYPRV